MVGAIREQMLTVQKKGKIFYNKVLILDDIAGFYSVEKVLKLYNTMTNLLCKSNLNKELLNKFIEINHYMNMISTLKVEDYTGIEHSLDMYEKFHDEMFEKWDKHIINTSNVFNYDIYNVELLEETEFDIFYDKLEGKKMPKIEYENKIFSCNDDEDYLVILSDDIYKKHSRHMYMFIKNTESRLEYDIAYSFRYFISQVRKIELKYSNEYNLLEMSTYGLHIEHIQAINQLLVSYNYLINSSSFRHGQLFEFDIYSIEMYISTAKAMVERVPALLKARLNIV